MVLNKWLFLLEEVGKIYLENKISTEVYYYNLGHTSLMKLDVFSWVNRLKDVLGMQKQIKGGS